MIIFLLFLLTKFKKLPFQSSSVFFYVTVKINYYKINRMEVKINHNIFQLEMTEIQLNWSKKVDVLI